MLENALTYWLMDDPHDQIETAFVPVGASVIVALLSQEAASACGSMTRRAASARIGRPSPRHAAAIAPLRGGGWVARYYHARQPEDLVRYDPALKGQTTLPSLTGLAGATAA